MSKFFLGNQILEVANVINHRAKCRQQASYNNIKELIWWIRPNRLIKDSIYQNGIRKKFWSGDNRRSPLFHHSQSTNATNHNLLAVQLTYWRLSRQQLMIDAELHTPTTSRCPWALDLKPSHTLCRIPLEKSIVTYRRCWKVKICLRKMDWKTFISTSWSSTSTKG